MADPNSSKYDPGPMPEQWPDDKDGDGAGSGPVEHFPTPPLKGPTGYASTRMVWQATPHVVGTAAAPGGATAPKPPPPTIDKIKLDVDDLRGTLDRVRIRLDALSGQHDTVIAAAQTSFNDNGFWGQNATDTTVDTSQTKPWQVENNSGVGSTVSQPTPQADTLVQGMATAFALRIEDAQEQTSRKVANALYLVGQWAAQVHSSAENYASADLQLRVPDSGPGAGTHHSKIEHEPGTSFSW